LGASLFGLSLLLGGFPRVHPVGSCNRRLYPAGLERDRVRLPRHGPYRRLRAAFAVAMGVLSGLLPARASSDRRQPSGRATLQLPWRLKARECLHATELYD
jgi:hypothetical protein